MASSTQKQKVFPMQKQQEPDWCWDAVAVSVARYFDPKTKWTQATLAEHVLDVTSVAQADQPFYLQNALESMGKLSENPQGFLSFAQIQQELVANRPVCVHIAWNEGGSHYVVVSGYGKSPGGSPQVYVSDPILQDGNVIIWDYDAFVTAYNPSYTSAEGTWADSCLVHP